MGEPDSHDQLAQDGRLARALGGEAAQLRREDQRRQPDQQGTEGGVRPDPLGRRDPGEGPQREGEPTEHGAPSDRATAAGAGPGSRPNGTPQTARYFRTTSSSRQSASRDAA